MKVMWLYEFLGIRMSRVRLSPIDPSGAGATEPGAPHETDFSNLITVQFNHVLPTMRLAPQSRPDFCPQIHF